MNRHRKAQDMIATREGPGDRGRHGISLLGFLVAVALLSFVLIPFYLAFQTSRVGTARSINSLMAANLASSQIERLRGLPYGNLELILLGLQPGQEALVDQVNGPFEAFPPRPDIVEAGAGRQGNIIYDRETYLSYFPQANPSPDDELFRLLRQRILVRVVMRWKEKISPGRFRQQSFVLSTIVHNEKYNPKPALTQLMQGQGGML